MDHFWMLKEVQTEFMYQRVVSQMGQELALVLAKANLDSWYKFQKKKAKGKREVSSSILTFFHLYFSTYDVGFIVIS